MKKIILLGSMLSGGDYDIKKSTITSGGRNSEGDNFTLSATIGQHDANTELTGVDFGSQRHQ